MKQEDGWVVCRVFKKKNHTRGFQTELDQEDVVPFSSNPVGGCTFGQKQSSDQPQYTNYAFDHQTGSMQLPQLLSPETVQPSFFSSLPVDMQSSRSLLRLTPGGSGGGGGMMPPDKFSGDWSFLDKLLATQQNMEQMSKSGQQFSQVGDLVSPVQRIPFPYQFGFEPDYSRFTK